MDDEVVEEVALDVEADDDDDELGTWKGLLLVIGVVVERLGGRSGQERKRYAVLHLLCCCCKRFCSAWQLSVCETKLLHSVLLLCLLCLPSGVPGT